MSLVSRWSGSRLQISCYPVDIVSSTDGYTFQMLLGVHYDFWDYKMELMAVTIISLVAWDLLVSSWLHTRSILMFWDLLLVLQVWCTWNGIWSHESNIWFLISVIAQFWKGFDKFYLPPAPSSPPSSRLCESSQDLVGQRERNGNERV